MKAGALILGIVVSVLLLAAAGVLHILSDDPAEPHYLTSIDLVREIQQLSARRSIEVARVRTDPLADFDAVTASTLRMEQLAGRLRDTLQSIPDLPSRTANNVSVFLSVIDANVESVERFKTSYAVVRNSTRYLPLSAATATRQAGESGIETLGAGIATLTQEINRYLVAPTSVLKARLAGVLEKLRESSVEYPPPLTNALANFLAHAEVLLSRQVPMNEMFQKATSDEVPEFGNRLIGTLEIEHDKVTVLTTWYDRGFLGAIGVLVMFWIALAAHHWGPLRAGGARPGEAQARDSTRILAPETTALHDEAAGADPRHPMEERDESVVLPAFGTIEGPRTTAAPAANPGAEAANLSREAAMQYGFLVERVGRDLVASAEKVSARLDVLRRTQRKILQTLQDSEITLDLPGGDDLDEEIEAGSAIAAHAHREINRLVSLVRRLASFSGLPAGDDERVMVDVNTCIREVIAAIGTEREAAVSMRLGMVPDIFASKAEIRLVLAQVIGNSMHAVKGLDGEREGSIKIDTMLHNDEILITIVDNGEGIAPDQRPHIFRPFHTTRDDAIGLGLTMAGILVKKHEGSVKISSMLGQGTVIRIALPTGTSGP